MKEKDRIWTLIAKQLANEISDEERNELEQLLKKYPDTSYPMELLYNLWQQSKKSDQFEIDLAFARHLQHMAEKEDEPEATPPTTGHTVFTWTSRPKTKDRLLSFLTTNGMLSNYCKIAWRNLHRSKVFSIINITGLAIGMAGAMLIFLWMQNELSFDLFHTKKDRLYQLYSRGQFDGHLACWGNTPMVMAPVLKANYPEVEEVTRMNWVAAFILKANDKQLQTAGFLTDPGFLRMFDFPMLKGNPHTALNDAHSIVNTEKLAKKFFGDKEAYGQTIRIDSNALFTVTGVLKDLPNNTRFEFEYLVPWSYMKEVGWYNPSWAITSIVETFVLLKPGVSEQRANALFKNMVRSHSDVNNDIFVHPLRKWRLWSRFENGVNTGGQISMVRLMGIIGAFILLIACINYMNLSTARSVKRAREVGIRKVAGAGKASLVGQFIGESVLISLVAGLVAILLVQQSIGWFNAITFKTLYVPYGNPWFWMGIVAFILLTGILAGSYPAFYLSAFKPVQVLKGSFKAVHSFITPRKILVVVQFTFAIVLIICTMVIYRQIAHAKNRDTGFDMNSRVFVFNKGNIGKNYVAIKEALLRSGAVTSMARSSSPITEIWSSEEGYEWEGQDKNIRSAFIKFYADKDLVQTMGLRLVAGRDIDAEKYPGDSNAILLNEAAVKLMKWTHPIGKTITNSENRWHVVGVVKNFVPGIPFDAVYPTAIQGPGVKSWFGTVTFKLNDRRRTADNLAAITNIIKQYNPDYPIQIHFVDAMYDMKFGFEKRTGELAAVFAGLTIFISCLGLFALAAYMAEQRIKEIGIRKVLGASIAAITALLSKDFLRLVLIAFVIASPIAWWMMHSWLQNYSYRVQISWWIFALTGTVSISIALLTVSYQAIKAALMNPARSLRSE